MDGSEPSFVLRSMGADSALEWRCSLSQVAYELGVDVDALAALRSETAVREQGSPVPALFLVPDAPEPPSLSWVGAGQGLTRRESEVLGLIVAGMDNRMICERLSITLSSVKAYIRSGYRKMGVETRNQATSWGVRHGFSPAA